MKTIEQLLELSKNPYYTFTDAEKVVLDDFLSRQKESPSPISVKKKKTRSGKSTVAYVRNVVEKTIPELKESGM